MKRYALVWAWAVAVVGSIAYNSAVRPERRIPFVPVVDISINGRELPVVSIAEVVDGKELIQELFDSGIVTAVKDLADRSYAVPEHRSFEELVHWANRFYWTTPKLQYRPELYDCDNFARAFSVFADFATVPTAKVNGQLAVARAYVKQQHAWGGVPAGGYHALTLAKTTRGWYVMEPQSGAITPLSEYPNVEYIMRVNFD